MQAGLDAQVSTAIVLAANKGARLFSEAMFALLLAVLTSPVTKPAVAPDILAISMAVLGRSSVNVGVRKEVVLQVVGCLARCSFP